MQIHSIVRKTPNKASRQVGRGGKRGKTSGRGHKGQKARAGHRIRPQIRDEIKKIPKLRGYRFSGVQDKPAVINLALLDKHFSDGETVTADLLVERKLIKRQKGKVPALKILGTGAISKKLTIEGAEASAAAKAKIEKAGGKFS